MCWVHYKSANLIKVIQCDIILSSDFMVPTNMRSIYKQIPRTSFRVIENLQVFSRCFSVISFLSSDFTVPTTLCNMCKKHLQNMCWVQFLNFLQIFQCFISFQKRFLGPHKYVLKIPFHHGIIFESRFHGFHHLH